MPPVIIAAAIGVGGALLSSKISSNAQKSAQKAAETSPIALAQEAAIAQQSAYGKTAGDAGTNLLPKYTAGVDYLSNYWKSVLSPDNAEALKAIAPLVQARKAQTGGQLRSLGFAPRGGGYGEAVSGIYDSQNRDILQALAGERTNARTNYAGLVGDVGARSTDLLRSGAGASGSSASLLGTIADRSLQVGQYAGQQAGNTVSGIADALSPLLYSMIFKQKTGGGTSQTPPAPVFGTAGKP